MSEADGLPVVITEGNDKVGSRVSPLRRRCLGPDEMVRSG